MIQGMWDNAKFTTALGCFTVHISWHYHYGSLNDRLVILRLYTNLSPFPICICFLLDRVVCNDLFSQAKWYWGEKKVRSMKMMKAKPTKLILHSRFLCELLMGPKWQKERFFLRRDNDTQVWWPNLRAVWKPNWVIFFEGY